MRRNHRLIWINCLLLALCGLGCPEDGAGGEPTGDPCQLASDCPEGSFCNEDGFCQTGFAEGTCSDDDDCPGEEICVKPDGVELGNCVYPHDCDEDADCNDPDKICIDADDDGYRDCVYDSCTDDAQCAEDLDNCPISDEPRCIAGACICVDYCGAPCGEGLVCCALPNEIAQCIPDPGACSDLSCDRGFHGEASGTVGDFSPTQCDYLDTECTCIENTPLPLETFGYPHVLLLNSAGNKSLLSYNATYGDVMYGSNVPNEAASYEFVAGVPQATDENVTGGLNGPREGISEAGEDVGSSLDAAIDSTGQIHAVWRNATTKSLEYGTLKNDAETWTVEVLDAQGDAGYNAHLTLVSDTQLIVTHVAIDNETGKSFVRVLAITLTDSAMTILSHDAYWRFVPDESDLVTTEDRLALSELEVVSSATAHMIFGYQAGAQKLWAVKQDVGDLFDEPTFSHYDLVASTPDSDPGHNPSAVAMVDGSFLVATTDLVKRELVLLEVGSNATLLGTTVLDDGTNLSAEGATSDHALNVPKIILNDSGKAYVAYSDGTTGDLLMKSRTADGTIDTNATLLLNASGEGDSFNGHHGFHIDGALHNGAVHFSVARLNAQGDRFSDIIIVPVAN